jgi:hypothetical protein
MLVEARERPMHAVREADDCHITELRWIVEVEGVPAGHHTLRGPVGPPVLQAPLPRWSATRAAWARELSWAVDVRPRVLRAGDAWAAALGIDETAGALVVRETGSGPGAVRVEHELVLLVRFAELAAPTWRTSLLG